MRSTHKIAAGVLGILLSFASPASLASLLSEDSAVKSEYMEAQRDSEVYSLIGEHVIPVGEVKQGSITSSNSVTAPGLSIKTMCVILKNRAR